jgi:hypothetical protein
MGGITPIDLIAGELGEVAKVLPARLAIGAYAARMTEPGHADSITAP